MKTASAENLRSRRVVAGSTWHRNSPGAPLARDPRRGVHPPLRQFGRWLATAALLVCLVLANRGLSKADIRTAEDSFVARGPAYKMTPADLLGQLDAVLAAHQGMRDALQDSAQG